MVKLKRPVLTADGIILKDNKILLVKRAIEPYSGYWVLSGGHVEYGERVEEAAVREIKEELGLKVKIKKLIGVYSDPKRDPRYHTVTVAYFCQKIKGKIRLNYEASEYKYFSLNNLPRKIGFDHRKIINDFKKALKKA
jgi:8-oxo-dGTP diphosphatase